MATISETDVSSPCAYYEHVCMCTHTCASSRGRLHRAYLDAGAAGLRLGLDADVSAAAALVPAIPVRVVPRVPTLVGNDGGDAVRRVGLDEQPVQRGRGALGDRGGLMRRVGLVRVSTVDDPALRDVDARGAPHTFRQPPPSWSDTPQLITHATAHSPTTL